MFTRRIINLLPILLCLHANASPTPNSCDRTEDWSMARRNSKFQPFVVKSNNSLINIFYPNDPKFDVYLISNEFEPCQIKMPLSYRTKYVRPYMATTLGNGNVVLWMLSHNEAALSRFSAWSFVVTDPTNCTQLDNFKIPQWKSENMWVLDVIGYENTFDIVMIPAVKSNETKNATVFRYDGSKEEMDQLLVLDGTGIPVLQSTEVFDQTRILPIKDHDRSEGYYYVQLAPKYQESTIAKLDENYQVVHLRNITSIKEGAAFSTVHGNITLCQFERSSLSDKGGYLTCAYPTITEEEQNELLRLDSIEDNLYRPQIFDIKNLSDSNFMLAYVTSENRDDEEQFVYLQVLNDSEKKKKLLGKVYCNVQGIRIFEMKEQEYCVSVLCSGEILTKCSKLEFENK